MTPARALAWNVSLSTERLMIEPLTAGHADALFEPMQDERLYRWQSATAPATREQLRERWQRLEARWTTDGSEEALLAWAARRASDGVYVGKLDANVKEDVATNLGYVFFPDHWGQGYAREAVRAVVRHLVRSGVREIRAAVTVGNDASARLLEAVGFARVRVTHGTELIRGVAHDEIEFVLDAARLSVEPG